MSLVPEVRFARSGNVDLAYQVFGDGPLDILVMIGWVSHLEILWELPECRRFLERYAAMGRVALFDKRGTGLSDRPSIEASTDEMVPDVLAVIDAVGMERAALVGWTDAAAIAMTMAAMHPQRVSALVLGEVLATSTPDEDHPWGPDPETFKTVAGVINRHVGPSHPPSAHRPFGDRGSADRELVSEAGADVGHSEHGGGSEASNVGDRLASAAAVGDRTCLAAAQEGFSLHPGPRHALAGRASAERPVRRRPGDETPGFLGDVDGLMDEVEEFLLGTRVGSAIDRRVATVLFSDVVGSTERAATVGDRTWSGLLEAHRAEARRLFARHSGREMNTAGDGFLIVFDALPRPSSVPLPCAMPAGAQASRFESGFTAVKSCSKAGT